MKSIKTKVSDATSHLSDLLGDGPRVIASIQILTELSQGLQAKLPLTDDQVQDAQDYIREVAEPGSYLESIADLIEELYAELHAKKAAKAAKASRTLVSTPNQKAVNTMVKNSRAWADGGYQVVGQSSVAIDDKE
jgi:hypothetical protein